MQRGDIVKQKIGCHEKVGVVMRLGRHEWTAEFAWVKWTSRDGIPIEHPKQQPEFITKLTVISDTPRGEPQATGGASPLRDD